MAQDANQDLNLKINAKNNSKGAFKSLRNSVQGAGQDVKKLGSGFKNFGSILGGGVVLGAMTKFSTLAIGQDRALKRMSIATKNVGKDFKLLEKDLLATTAALQNKTNFGDEEQMMALSNLIPMVGDYDEAVSKLPELLDFAAFSGQSAASATRQFGQALQGNFEGLGRNFDFLKKMKKEGYSTADMFEALKERIDGFAEADADPITQLTNDLGDLGEEIGSDILPYITDFKNAFRDAPDIVRKLTVALPPLITAFALLGGPLVLASTAMGVLLVVATKISKGFSEAKEETLKYAKGVKNKTEAEIISARISEKILMLDEKKKGINTFILDQRKKGIKLSELYLHEKKEESKELTIETARLRQVVRIYDKLSASKDKANKINKTQKEEKKKPKIESDDPSLTDKEKYEKGVELAEKKRAIEIELIQDEFAQKRAIVEEWYNKEFADQAENNDLLIELKKQKNKEIEEDEKEHFAQLDADKKASNDKDLDDTRRVTAGKLAIQQSGLSASRNLAGALSGVFQSLAEDDKKYANIYKGIAYGEAIISTALGVSKSIAKGGLIGIAQGVTVGIAGGVQVAKIARQEFQTPEDTIRTIPGNSTDEVPIMAHGGETIGRDSSNNGITVIVQGDVYNADETIPKIANGLRNHKKLTGEEI